jgi:hypothetical protein
MVRRGGEGSESGAHCPLAAFDSRLGAGPRASRFTFVSTCGTIKYSPSSMHDRMIRCTGADVQLSRTPESIPIRRNFSIGTRMSYITVVLIESKPIRKKLVSPLTHYSYRE